MTGPAPEPAPEPAVPLNTCATSAVRLCTSAASDVGSCGQRFLDLRVLGRPAPFALLSQHLAVGEEMPAPDAPGLTPLERTLEAGLGQRAQAADGLGPGDVIDLLREEQADHRGRAVPAAGVGPVDSLARLQL